MRTLHPRLTVLLLVTFMTACAGLTVKQKLYATHQTLHSALVTADRTEKEICGVDPAAKNHCLLPVLTNTQHQEISQRIVKLYDIDAALSQLVTDYQKGQPVPAQIDQMQTLVRELGALAQTITPGPKTDRLVAQVNEIAAQAAQIAAIFAGRGPAPMLAVPPLSLAPGDPARLETRFELPRPVFARG